LRTAVARTAELSQVQDGDGLTLYDHLSRLRDQYGIVDPRLEPIDIPECVEWIHTQFWRLNRRREISQMGGAPMPLSFMQIETLERLNRIPFTRFDIDAIEQMDAAYLSAVATTKRG
jgi:hypothetical protein